MNGASDVGRAHVAALQRLATALSAAATPSAVGNLTITSVAQLLGADGAAVYTPTPGPDGAPATLQVAHASGWPTDATRHFGLLDVQPGRPLSDAVLTGRPVWLENPQQWAEQYPEMAPAGTSSGFRSTACLPLRVDDRDLGAVVFSFTRSRTFTPDEREYMVATAALCAQALDRSRLYAAELAARTAAEAQRDRMAFLALTGRLMEAPLSVDERLQRVADLAVPEIADWCAVHLVRDDRVEQIAVAHADPEKVTYVEQLQRRYPSDPDAGGGAIAVARSGKPVLLTDIPDELLTEAAVDDTHLQLIRAIGMRSAVVVPLVVRGRSLGALTLVHAESGLRFTDADLAFVEQLAATAAVALDNARLYEQQRHIAHTLQSALLPAVLPEVPGMQVAARYRPQSADLTEVYIGGDLYDVLVTAPSPDPPTSPGGWAAMVGDVCGKGPAAAALTALVRHTWRAHVSQNLAPADVVRGVNAALLRGSPADTARFATLVHAQLRTDRPRTTVSLVSAGHPPPLVLRGDRVEAVTAPGTLVGVYADLALTEIEIRLDPGDSLVLYTDGVTEGRSADGYYGAHRLAAAVSRCAGATADGIAGALLEDVCAFQHDRLSDDVAIFVMQATA